MNNIFYNNDEELFFHQEYSFERTNFQEFTEINEIEGNCDPKKTFKFNKTNKFFKIQKQIDKKYEINSTEANLKQEASLLKKKRFYKVKPFLKEISPEEFNRRKWRNDSFMKRIRRIFFKYVKERCYQDFNLIINLDNNLKAKISIDFNSKILLKSVDELFKAFLLEKEEYTTMRDKNIRLKEFTDTPLFKIYYEFMESSYLQNVNKEVEEKEGSDFFTLFSKFCNEFLDFYLNPKSGSE